MNRKETTNFNFTKKISMDLQAALHEIETWPVEDRIELVHRVWDGLIESGWQSELTEEQAAELDRRLKDLDEHPDNVVTWESILEYVRRKR